MRLKEEKDDTTVKDINYLFKLKKENQAIKNRRLKDIVNLFECKEDYYKPIRVGDF